MKLVFAFTEFDVDILDVPSEIISNIKKVCKQFDKWLYDKNNKETWDKERQAFCFRGDMFVYWLNEYYLKDKEKALMIVSQPDEYDHNLPTVWY
ncbi:MAG: hypothetical protein ACI4XE_08995 [Acutalibacteraceae bacterium]